MNIMTTLFTLPITRATFILLADELEQSIVTDELFFAVADSIISEWNEIEERVRSFGPVHPFYAEDCLTVAGYSVVPKYDHYKFGLLIGSAVFHLLQAHPSYWRTDS